MYFYNNPNQQPYIFIKLSQHMDKKLQINDLLSSLQNTQNQIMKNQEHTIPDFVTQVEKQKGKKVQNISKSKQQMMRREANYEMTKQEMDKWIGIVKLNREKESLNFVKKDVADMKVNFFPAQPISDFHKKIDDKLKQMNMQSSKAVLKQENTILQKVDPQEAKRRLIQARKHRTTVFYQEQKRRRISKIKSKLYHKIKKRQKMREEVKKVDQMTPAQKSEYIEALTKKRIKERISLRHNSKNKHIQNLLRFNRNEKNGIQSTMNEVNQIRRKELQRVNQNLLQEISEDYDDENFREEAMNDLQKQIQALENQQMDVEPDGKNEGLNDLKFMQVGKKNKQSKDKKEAYKLLGKLAQGDDLSEKDLNSEMDEQNGEAHQSEDDEDGKHVSRKIYGKKLGDNNAAILEHGNKNKSMESQLNKYLMTQDNNMDDENEEKKKKNYDEELISGINVQKLQQKYQPERIPIDLSTLIAQNRQIYQENDNEAALENMREFQQQKMNEYERQVEEKEGKDKNKRVKGWGSWAGPGIQQKKVDPQEELRKKLKKIEEIKQKRKDASLAHVSINQARNKKLSEYFVKNLPHNYNNPDQFDFMQNEPIGPQWNSLTQFKDNVKPKIITKAGQVIQAARLPKKIQNLNTKG